MQKQEMVQLLQTNMEEFNEYRREHPDEIVDLSSADLSYRNLERANLGNANLQGAILAGASLVKANLGAANLQDADLRGADLTDSTLHRANLAGADLRDAVVGGLTGAGRMCLHPSCFEGVQYDRNQLEAALEVLNRNAAWEIRYELVRKPNGAGEEAGAGR